MLLFFLLSCCTAAPKVDPTAEPEFDPTLRLVYNQFIVDAEAHGSSPVLAPSLKVFKFVSDFTEEDTVSPNQIAICTTRLNNKDKTYYKEIQILRSAWATGFLFDAPFTNRVIAYHEMGHCIFDVPHSKVEKSIMYKSVYADEDYWRENWPKKVDQLFDYIQHGDPEPVEIRID